MVIRTAKGRKVTGLAGNKGWVIAEDEFGRTERVYDPEAFLALTAQPVFDEPTVMAQDLLSQGKTPATTQTLQRMGATDLDIDEFFGVRLDPSTGQFVPATEQEILQREQQFFATEGRRDNLQNIIETVFPGRTTGVLEDDLIALEKYINDTPDAFWEDIQTLGRTPETEALLRLIPWERPITEEDIDIILGTTLEMGQVQAVLEPEPEWQNALTGEVITQSEKDRRFPKGFEPELDEWRLTVETARNYTHVFRVFGEALLKLPEQMAAAILQATQSFMGASAVDKDWADKLITLASEDQAKFVEEVTARYTGTRLPIQLSDIAALPQSMAFSLVSVGTFAAVALPIAAIPAPGTRIAAWAAGTAASGAVAFNMSSYQIMQSYLDIKNEEMKATAGRELTLAEENQLKRDFSGLAVKYGLWEAVPEALSNLAFARLLTLPLSKMVGRNVATQVISKVTGIYGQEFLTETITQKGQSAIEVEAGLREGRITWIEAFKEIFAPTFLLTTILGGAGQITVSSVNRIKKSLKKEADAHPEKQVIYDAIKDNITEDVFAEVEAESVENLEEAKQVVPEPTRMTLREENQLKNDIADLKRKLPTAPAEEKTALQQRIAALERDLEIGEALAPPEAPKITPEAVPVTPEVDIGLGERIITPEDAAVIQKEVTRLVKQGVPQEKAEAMVGKVGETTVVMDFEKLEQIRNRITAIGKRTEADGTFEELMRRWFNRSDMVSLNHIGDVASKDTAFRQAIQEILREQYPSGYIRIFRGRGKARGRALEREYTNVTSSRTTAQLFEETWGEDVSLEIDNIIVKVEDILAIGSIEESELFIKASVLKERIDKPITFPEVIPPKPPAVEVVPLSIDEVAELITKADKLIAEGKRAEADAVFEEVSKRGIEDIPAERVIYSEGGIPINPDETIPQQVADTIPVVQDIGVLERVRPTRKVFEKMGLYRLFKGIQKAEVLVGEARQAFAKQLKEVNKWVDKSRRHLVFRELETPGSQVGLTFNEKRALAFFRENFNKWADALNLPQEKRIKNYITHIFEADIAEQLKAKHPLDISIARALEYRAAKTIFNPFLQERLGAKVGLIEDPFAAATAYESRQLRVFYYEPLLEKIASIANDEKTPTAIRGFLKDYSDRMTNKPSKIDLEINTTLLGLADKIRGLPGGNPLANVLSRGNPAGMASYNFTSMLYVLWLGFKPTSAIRNLSQHTLIIGEVGPVHFADGIKLRFTAEGKAALDDSLVWRSRRAAFVPGIDDSFTNRWSDTFRETALFMFRQADAQNVKDAFLAGYSEAKALLPNADRQVWIDRGDEVAADTQYLYTKMNSFSLAQNSVGRVFSILTTWSVNWMELMTKWVSRRPSQVYLEYEKATGEKVTGGNWSTSYKAILIYMIIVGLGYLIKERTRIKAWEYTGITSIRYLADVAGGDFPGLQAPGAIANLIAGFLTDDERRFKQGWNEMKSTFTPGILRQIEDVATGEKDWMTLLFYLEGKDFKLRQLKDKWKTGWKEYDALAPKDRDDYRKENPLIEAEMFVAGRFTTLSSDKARAEVLRLIEEHDIDTELIKGYEKVFGVDTDQELTGKKKLLGTVELTEEGEQKLKENGELDYFTTSNFASEVNKLEKVVGRFKIVKDGNALAIEYLNAKDLWVAYEDFTDEAARILYRQQFPDVEAQLYLWGRISTFKNPKSADLLLALMDKYNIPPEAVPAFLDNPEKYDELFTKKFELEKKWFDLSAEYENYGNPESPLFIEDAEVRKEARQKLKDDNPNWIADLVRIEAIDHDATDKITESWAEREKIIVEFGSNSAESKLWLIDNPAVHKWALGEGLLTDDGSGWNEQVLRLNVELRGLDEDSEQFRVLTYKKKAFEIDFSEPLIDTYVEWYTSATLKKPEDFKLGWYEDDWFLIEHRDFYQEMLAKGVFAERKDFRKVPTREVFDLWVIYNSLPRGTVRKDYRLKHPDFDDWLVDAKGYAPAEGVIEDPEGLTEAEKLAKRLADLLKRSKEL